MKRWIGYGKFDGGENGTLNIVGAGKQSGSRKVRVWARTGPITDRQLVVQVGKTKTKLERSISYRYAKFILNTNLKSVDDQF